MLSGRLVHLIEANSASIIQQVIKQIEREPDLSHLRKLPESELREYGRYLLEKLGDWLAAGSRQELAAHFETRGRIRFEEGIPLSEAVRGLILVKEKMIDFVLDQAAMKTFMQLYAEEELEHRVDRFFDMLICHMIRGYEDAWQKPEARAAVHAR